VERRVGDRDDGSPGHRGLRGLDLVAGGPLRRRCRGLRPRAPRLRDFDGFDEDERRRIERENALALLPGLRARVAG